MNIAACKVSEHLFLVEESGAVFCDKCSISYTEYLKDLHEYAKKARGHS
jgi:hypothetical protein